MKLLLTGFDPFGGEQVNPSYEVAKRIPEVVKDIEVKRMEIPTIRYEAPQKIIEVLQAEPFDFVIMLGQAGGIDSIHVERVAINCDDYRMKDNAMNQPKNECVVKEGPVGYFATLPIDRIVEQIQQATIPATISNSAGTFVCNHTFYTIAHYIETNHLATKYGFIHIPYLPEQTTEKPSMELDTLVKAITIAIESLSDIGK